jgi:hypothetical protein
MANNNGKYIKLASLIVIVIIAVGGVIASYAVNADDIDEIKNEGCLPSRKNGEAIIKLQSDVEHTRETVDKIWKKMEK